MSCSNEQENSIGLLSSKRTLYFRTIWASLNRFIGFTSHENQDIESSYCSSGSGYSRELDSNGSSKSVSIDSISAIGTSSPVLLHTVSSQVASFLSTSCFYPIDVIRTRYMSQDGTIGRQHNGTTYRSLSNALQTVYNAEGRKGLFKGLSVALSGTFFAWGGYMFVYRSLCNWLEATTYFSRSGISMLASGVSTMAASPIFLIKSRMQLEESSVKKQKGSSVFHYRSFRTGIAHILKSEGWKGLWRGGTLQLSLIFPYCLAVPTYDFLKLRVLLYHEAEKQKHLPRKSTPALLPTYSLSPLEIIACSGLTKVFLLLLSHPIMVIRTRIQDHRVVPGPVQYRSLLQSTSLVLKHQGVTGMYRGFTTSLLHSLPRAVLQYFLYEKMLNMLLAIA